MGLSARSTAADTKRLKAVDFFCGAGGMSYGLTKAGIHVLAGIDNARDCEKTYLANVPGAEYIRRSVEWLSAPELGRLLKLKKDDPRLLFSGCSPCQFWSKIRTDRTRSARTSQLLSHFRKFIRYFRPGFVVVENVPGLFRKKNESILGEFLEFLKSLDYVYADGLVNANNYGVPQNRIRYLLVATRLSATVSLPEKDEDLGLIVRKFIGVHNGFPKINAGHIDPTDRRHTASALSEANLRRIELTAHSGGTRIAWSKDAELQISAYRERDNIFRDVYGRMSWDKPSPTITTRFHSLSNGRFGHPEENRAISIREGATLQTFPPEYRFVAPNLSSVARQIGNAVPPEMARRIGLHLSRCYPYG